MKKLTNHERATKAAAARWKGVRLAGARIYVDADVAAMLESIFRPSARRKFVSETLREAIKNRNQ